jgi:hypothetical protein
MASPNAAAGRGYRPIVAPLPPSAQDLPANVVAGDGSSVADDEIQSKAYHLRRMLAYFQVQ